MRRAMSDRSLDGSAESGWYEQARRRLGAPAADGDWAWCRHGVVDALALPLDGGPVELWLAAGAQRSLLPRRWPVGVRVVSRARPCAQAATAGWPGGATTGTVGVLLRDRFDAARHFALCCGHVFAGADGAALKMKAPVDLRIGGVAVAGAVTLRDWEPAFGHDVLRSGLDAALIDIEDAAVGALSALGVPSGVSSDLVAGQAVSVLAAAPKAGELKTRWSGYVDIPGHASATDFYLSDAVAYLATPGTAAGDSGAAIVDAKSGALLGIHVAAPLGDERLRSNAVYCPIGRIMDWFDIEPLTHALGADGPSLPRQQLVAAPPALLAVQTPAQDAVVVAQTIWGEARGEPHEGGVAVGWVIRNRLDRHWLKATTAAQVCRAPSQFSCWLDGDPNRPLLDKIPDHPDAPYLDALAIWADIVAGRLADPTVGATHYYALSLPRPPSWALGHAPCARIGNQLFFNDVR